MNKEIMFENINRYNIQSNLFLLKSNTFLKNDKLAQFNNNLDLYQYKNISYFHVIGNKILLLDKFQRVLNPLIFPNIPIKFAVNNFGYSDFYLLLINEDTNSDLIYSCIKNKIIHDIDFRVNLIIDDYLITCIGYIPEIIVRDIEDLKILSYFQLVNLGTFIDGVIETKYEVSYFCGIYEQKFICTLNSGDVLLLNINNTKDYKLLKGTNFPRKLYPKENHSHIYTGLFARHYVEIDVISGTILKDVSIEEELRKIKNVHWFSVGFSVLYGNLFYFLAETNFVGVYDPELNKIIDYYEFDFDKSKYQQLKGGEENLQVKDGKIYCLDTLGNLYELELENFLPRFVSSRTANENKKMN